MSLQNIFSRFVYAMLLFISTAAFAQNNGGASTAHVPGRLLIKFKDGVANGRAQGLLGDRGALSTNVIPQLGIHVVQLPPNANEQAEINAFKGLDEVEFAEVDAILQPQSVAPNDYYYFIGYQWGLSKISAPDAWSVTTGNSSVVIAVLDTGVDSTQPDLQGKLVPGWNVYDNNSNTADVGSHGTVVAGIVGAASNNSIGIAGVCWNCRVMPVRVTGPDQSVTLSNIANGIIWAADHGARVANASFACTNSSTVSSAAQYLQSRGGVLTVASGNYSMVDTNPNDPFIITVGATDPNDALYSGSATGSDIDLVAPGIAQSTMPFSMYGAAGGTSVAAPFVAGVVGLMLSVNPSLTPSQVSSMLPQSVDDLGPAGWDSTYGWGRLNALKAVNNAMGTGTPSRPVINSALTASGVVSTAFNYQITATNSPTSYSATGLPSGLSVNTATGLISGTPAVSGGFSVALSATNSGGTGTATLSLTTTVASSAPVITSSLTASGTQSSAFSYQITANSSPTSYGASGLPSGLSVNTSTGLISGTPSGSGSFNVTISAANSSGTGMATLSLTINAATVVSPPAITSSTNASGTVARSFSYQITATNGPTSFGASGLPSGLSVNSATGAISGTPSVAGTYSVSLSASNSRGTGFATLTLTIGAKKGGKPTR